MPGPKLENAASGTIVSTRVLTDAPVDAPPRALLVSALSCWLRTASEATAAAAFAAVSPGVAAVVRRSGDRAGGLRAADRAAGRADIDVLQCFRALPELRRDPHHHMILVEIVVDRRHLALAECVIKRVVDLRRVDAEPRRGVAVDLEIDLQPLVLAVGIDVVEFGHVLQRVGDLRHPFVELVQRVGLQRVLIGAIALAAARAGHAAGIGQEQARARDARKRSLQPPDDLIGARARRAPIWA